jgi:hypothetical protein
MSFPQRRKVAKVKIGFYRMIFTLIQLSLEIFLCFFAPLRLCGKPTFRISPESSPRVRERRRFPEF